MKNIKADPEDSLRPEYKRSDFGELIRGKYATTQVDFHQLIEALLACIGEDEGVKFIHHSIGNCIANHKPGDWTYEIDNGSIEEAISNPTCVMTANNRTELQDALLRGVTGLKTKLAALEERQ